VEVALFLSLLAVAGQVALALLAALWGLSRVSSQAERALLAVRESVAGRELALAWLVAATATAGSLYFSEVKDFPPCELCWYQRIFMYPLVLVLAVAAVHGERSVARYALPLVGVGAAISVYHYQLELFPEQESGFCTASVPCNVRWVWELGYVSIPLLALTAFLLIGALLLLARRSPGAEADG
jgi:Disulfide bond formation protein DsbB